MGRRKPTGLIESESTGQTEKVVYPDKQTFNVKACQDQGLTISEIAVELELSESTVNREIKIFKDCLSHVFDPESVRQELNVYMGLAKSDIASGMARGKGTIGLRFMEGMGILSPKTIIGADKSTLPPEYQVIELCDQLAQVPAYRAIMLNALGLGESVESVESTDHIEDAEIVE